MQEKHPILFREFWESPYIFYRLSDMYCEHLSIVHLFITFTICIKITYKKSAAKLAMSCGSLDTVVITSSSSDYLHFLFILLHIAF